MPIFAQLGECTEHLEPPLGRIRHRVDQGTGMRVVVATRPVDFRKGHDGLAAVVEQELGLDPYSGVAVVFRPKRIDRVTLCVPAFRSPAVL